MSIFKRLFRVGQAEANALVDKMEDPVKMTEQGIKDLRSDLQQAMTSLAEVKSMAMRTRREADNNAKLAADYERKAMLLLQKMQNGEIEVTEGRAPGHRGPQQKGIHRGQCGAHGRGSPAPRADGGSASGQREQDQIHHHHL